MDVRPLLAANLRGPMPILLAASLAGWAMVLGAGGSDGSGLCVGLGGSALAIDWGAAGWSALSLLFAVHPPAELLAAWLAMLLAMAPPLLAHPVTRLATSARTWRAVGLFLAVYGAGWAVVGLAMMCLAAALAAFAPATGLPAPALAVGLAMAWQAAPPKRAALTLCRQPPMTLASHRDVLGYSLRTTAGCVGACWALMLVPLVAGPAERPLMAAVAALLVVEREGLLQHVRRGALRRLQPPFHGRQVRP